MVRVIVSAKDGDNKVANLPATAWSISGGRCCHRDLMSRVIVVEIAITSVSSSTVPRRRCQGSILDIRPMKSWTFWKNRKAGRMMTSSNAASASSSPESTSAIELSGDCRSVLTALSPSVRNKPSPPALTALASRRRSHDRSRLSEEVQMC